MDNNNHRHFSLCTPNTDKTPEEEIEDDQFFKEVSADPDHDLKLCILLKTRLSVRKLEKLIMIIQKTENCTPSDAIAYLLWWNADRWGLL